MRISSAVRSQFQAYYFLTLLSSVAVFIWVTYVTKFGLMMKFVPALLLLCVGVFACAKLIVITNTQPNLLEDETSQ
jgi:hypothetical protein